MNIYSVELATNIAFGYPTMVFGKMGTGKLFVALEAIKMLKAPTLEIDICKLRNEPKNYVPDFNGRLNRHSNKMQEIDAQIAADRNQVILYTGIEYAYYAPHWMMHMLQQMLEHPKVIMVGEEFTFKPILERCRTMSMNNALVR